MRKLLFFCSLVFMLVMASNVNAQITIPTKTASFSFTNRSADNVFTGFSLRDAITGRQLFNKNVMVEPAKVFGESVKVNTGDYILTLYVYDPTTMTILTFVEQQFHVHYSTSLRYGFINGQIIDEGGISQ